MRERTPLPRNVLERLPHLKMIASTGPFNASIDMAAAKERGIYVSGTGGYVESTVELTWALISRLRAGSSTRRYRCAMAAGRPRSAANSAARCWVSWGWGESAAESHKSARRLGWTIAWSSNLTPEAAAQGGPATCRRTMFGRADVLTIHLVLSERSRGLVGADELA